MCHRIGPHSFAAVVACQLDLEKPTVKAVCEMSFERTSVIELTRGWEIVHSFVSASEQYLMPGVSRWEICYAPRRTMAYYAPWRLRRLAALVCLSALDSGFAACVASRICYAFPYLRGLIALSRRWETCYPLSHLRSRAALKKRSEICYVLSLLHRLAALTRH